MLAGRVLLEGPDKFWESTDWHVDVTNAAGLILFRLDFSATDSPALVSANSNQPIRERRLTIATRPLNDQFSLTR